MGVYLDTTIYTNIGNYGGDFANYVSFVHYQLSNINALIEGHWSPGTSTVSVSAPLKTTPGFCRDKFEPQTISHKSPPTKRQPGDSGPRKAHLVHAEGRVVVELLRVLSLEVRV